MLVVLLDATGFGTRADVLDGSGRVLTSAESLGGDRESDARQVLGRAFSAAPDGDWLGLMVIGPDAAHERDGLLLTRHDELVAAMTGVLAMPLPYAAATGLLDVAGRCWDAEELRRSASRVPALVESGTVVGETGPGWGVPQALPVVTGAPRHQLLALAAGASAAGSAADLPGGRLLVSADPFAVPPGWSAAPYALPGLWAFTGPADPSLDDAGAVPVDVPMTVAVAVLVARAVGAHAHLPHRRG